MDKQRKIIFPDGREEIVRFVDFETKGYVGVVELPGLYCAAYDHYSLLTDNATYKLKVYKDRKAIINRGGALLTDSELPSLILLKGDRSCEFPELPENGKPACEKWVFDRRRLHTEAEETRLHRAALERDKTASKVQDHKAAAQAVAPHAGATILREHLVLSPGAMPKGPVGDALRALAQDVLQIFNLRLKRNDKGKLLSWREVAALFKREGKESKSYTAERCRQIYVAAIMEYPALEQYIKGLSTREHVKLTRENTDAEEIEEMTTQKEFDKRDLSAGDNPGYRITTNPRRPINLPNLNK